MQVADPRRASPPRLGLLERPAPDRQIDGLTLAFSQFPDAFAFTSSGTVPFTKSNPESSRSHAVFLEVPPYQEQLHLKSVDDMILGFNIIEHADGKEVLLLTSGMVLAAQPDFDNITKMKDDVQ